MAFTSMIGVVNHSEAAIIVYVEPWAESFALARGETQTISATGGVKNPWFNVVYSTGVIQVYVEDGESFTTTATLK